MIVNTNAYYRDVTSFDRLPDRLRLAVEGDHSLGDTTDRNWRKVSILSEVLKKPVGEMTLTIPAGTETELVTLIRLYDGHFPTRYFVGKSNVSGDVFWAE